MQAFASGFLLYNQDAAATALATAVTAQIDNPSAIFYNPAAINQLKGTQTSFGTTIVMPTTKFKSYQTGKTTHMRNHIYVIPNAYITHQLNDSLSIGIGSFSHFGLTTDWDDEWEGRFLSTYAQLRTFSANPVISWQINPELSVAVGGSVVYSDINMRKDLNPKPIPIKLGSVDLDAWDVGYSYNFGVRYKMNNNVTFGVSYRSSIDMRYKGNSHFKTSSFIRRFLPDNDVKVDMTLPPILGSGAALSFCNKWTIEFDVYWVGWSRYNDLSADFKKGVRPSFDLLNPPIPRSYHNILDYSLGVKYQANELTILRCGFMYDSSPVPRAEVDPIVPDANKYCFTAGLSILDKKCYSIDLTYYGIVYRTIKTRNNYDGLNGRYVSSCNMFSLSFDYKL
jgi:long-chain fatty acid transport protein